ncbi:hypothetical protein BPAE_0014g00680 [Botrytis paeoniae]|uniref:Heterokaryon incompatibility domain-containing protein n=1 Tax=Botrytis paeoniae TaxID=278948 RepID=A0A4Z1G645_9HELO|nr:hypothetical protein BPAE_0014g00680 [Botrytis paeoniae]
MTSGVPFQYLPLERASDVRLLQISLSTNSKRLYGKFTHVSSDVVPPTRVPYAAISYHWRSADMCDQIWFDEEHYLCLNSSAGTILRSFATHLDFEFEPCFPWIDALCINQNDNIEKGLQVRQMGRIYSSALQVLAWIGDESMDSDLAMDFVVILYELMTYFGSPTYSDFSRTWIIQEVVLGTDIVLLCGQKALNWRALGLVANMIVGMDLEKLLLFRQDGSFPDGLGASALIYQIKELREKGSSVTLEYALFQGLDFKTTNPRDKVYAFFGISTDIEAMGIDVNYNATVKEVYTDATTRILNQGTFLSLLNAAGIGRYRNDKHTAIDHDLPSWVPDFSYFPDSSLLVIPVISANYKTPEASKATKSLININSTNPDRVSMKIIGRSVSSYSRTLVNNKLPLRIRGAPVETPYWKHLEVFLEVLENILGANAEEVREIEMAGGVVEGFDEDTVEKLRKFASGFAFRGRMFETDNGYLGMGQEGMEVGDEVCLFYGGQTPYIIREVAKGFNQTSEHEYVLLGDCYVDGWMDGEAMEMGEEKEFMLV